MSQAIERYVDAFKRSAAQALKRKFVVLLGGRTGVGKSSTINSLLGEDVAPVGDYEPTTFDVSRFDTRFHGVRFVVVDTPGLCDDLPEKGNDADYLGRIREQVEELDHPLR